MSARQRIDVRSVAVIAAGYFAGLAAWPRLPGPFLDQALFARGLVAFGLPTTALVIYALLRSLWTHDRIRSGNGAFEATYSAIVFCLVLFVVALHTLVMAELVGVYMPKVWAMRAVVVLLGLTFVAVGNLLPRTRPNVAIGVRTRQTLANGQVWTQVHRVGGYVTVLWGVVITASAVALSGPVLGLAIGLSGVAAVAVLVATYRRVARA
jgi:uncharacterized membrane protein